jgi:hypothetical protein
MSKFRVEKGRAEAELTLANGETLRGCFFVAKWSATRGGPERVVDLLNAEAGFFPFEAKEFERTVLVNRAHVVAARLAAVGEAARDSGYDVAPVREVVMRLSNRMVLRGNIRIYGPAGRLRPFSRAVPVSGVARRHLRGQQRPYRGPVGNRLRLRRSGSHRARR